LVCGYFFPYFVKKFTERKKFAVGDIIYTLPLLLMAVLVTYAGQKMRVSEIDVSNCPLLFDVNLLPEQPNLQI